MVEGQYSLNYVIEALQTLNPQMPVQVKFETIREPENKYDRGEHAVTLVLSYQEITDYYERLLLAADKAKVLGGFLGCNPPPKED